MDKIIIKDLLLRGIVGINPDERIKKQDILVNVIMYTDIRSAAISDKIEDAVNYKLVTKRIIQLVEVETANFLVEKLVTDIARLILTENQQVVKVQVSVEKPTALRYARSVGIEIERTRSDIDLM